MYCIIFIKIMIDMKDIKVGLFFGSDTGTTEAITQDIVNLWSTTQLDVIDACEMTVEDYMRYDYIMIGLPTWYDGELQSDFEDFFDQFQTIDFTGKTVAMYGLGDQYGYADYFVDGLGILGEVILRNGGQIIGMWPNDDQYDFENSKGLYTPELFYGLAIDEDNQVHLTEERLKQWIAQIESELHKIYVKRVLAA